MELVKINKLSVEEKAEKNRTFAEELKTLPIAIQQDKGEHNNTTEMSITHNIWIYAVLFLLLLKKVMLVPLKI